MKTKAMLRQTDNFTTGNITNKLIELGFKTPNINKGYSVLELLSFLPSSVFVNGNWYSFIVQKSREHHFYVNYMAISECNIKTDIKISHSKKSHRLTRALADMIFILCELKVNPENKIYLGIKK